MDTRFISMNQNIFGFDAIHPMDTTLHLDHVVSSILYTSTTGNKRKRDSVDTAEISKEDILLALGAGRSAGRPSSSLDNSKMSTCTAYTMSSAKETDEVTSMNLELNFQLHLGSNGTHSPKRTVVDAEKSSDLQLSLTTGPQFSMVTNMYPVSFFHQNYSEMSESVNDTVSFGDGSTSSRWASGGLVLPYVNSIQAHDLTPAAPFASSLGKPAQESSITWASASTLTQRRCNSSTKICLFQGCEKGARGASGLCIGHGGGRRCQREGCAKGAEGRTIYCKAHGGGRRCEFLGCTKSAEGHTDYCIGHGGGQRCGSDGCLRASRGKSGFCIRHGGGKRCQKEGCSKSAEGYTGRCISHGGGKRCCVPSCNKGAQGSTMLCKAHGGGKRCTFFSCNKGAEGSTAFCKGHGGGKRCTFKDGDDACPRSVHGGTLFCVRHGGGKRCAVPDCTSSARGSTSFCVSHGGGRRCKFEGCGKSSQGSTDFCKAHGGGKRCSWGKMVSVFGIPGSPCDRHPRGSNGLCTAHSALLQDHKVHGGASVGIGARNTKNVATKVMLAGNGNHGKNPICRNDFDHQFPLESSSSIPTPEERVHGGIIMAMLSENASFSSRSIGHANGVSIRETVPHKWI